jgi:hypothetical protein
MPLITYRVRQDGSSGRKQKSFDRGAGQTLNMGGGALYCVSCCQDSSRQFQFAGCRTTVVSTFTLYAFTAILNFTTNIAWYNINNFLILPLSTSGSRLHDGSPAIIWCCILHYFATTPEFGLWVLFGKIFALSLLPFLSSGTEFLTW